MKIDPYKHKERYLNWKEKVNERGIPGISKANSDLILRYLYDMALVKEMFKLAVEIERNK